MRILLDENIDPGLAPHVLGHEVRSVRDMGLLGLTNGRLLAAADVEFDAFVTCDKNLPYQVNLAMFDLIIIVLDVLDNKLETLAALAPRISIAVSNSNKGQVLRLKQTLR